MKDLRCSMDNCSFNKGFCCHARRITVTVGTDCAAYEPNMPKADDNNIMFEAGMDGFSLPIAETKVACKAEDCLFNARELCTANGISVISENKSPICASYIRK